MAQIELKVKGYRCERCRHEWQPHKKDYPRTCPSCKSPYWDKPRKEKKMKDKMTRFFIKQKKLDPYTEAVADVFNRVNKKVTPSEVAEYLKIHPNTAKNRILKLEKKGYVICEKEGKKLFCSRRKTFKF